jgi:hypothetical protein
MVRAHAAISCERRGWAARNSLTTVVGALFPMAAQAKTFRALSLRTHAGPAWTSFCEPAMKYEPATTTSAVDSGHPKRGERRLPHTRASIGAARNGTVTSSSSTSLWRTLPRLVRRPATTSSAPHAATSATRRTRHDAGPTATTAAATTPTTCRSRICPADGMPGSRRVTPNGRHSAGGCSASVGYGHPISRSPMAAAIARWTTASRASDPGANSRRSAVIGTPRRGRGSPGVPPEPAPSTRSGRCARRRPPPRRAAAPLPATPGRWRRGGRAAARAAPA